MLQPSVLRRRAGEALQKATYNPKKLVLIHTAVAVGSFLLVNIINYLLSLQIAQTGGLGGIGLRAMLTSVQTFLDLAVSVALPFWELGLIFAALQWAKEASPTPKDLPTGFYRFGPILRLRVLQGALFFVVGIGVFNISYILFMLTPFADAFLAQLEPFLSQAAGAENLITEELLIAAGETLLPLLFLFGALFAGVSIFLFYRIRFADYIIMEERSALKALIKSVKLTKKHCLQLAKLDFSFWWFYLLQAATIAIGYGDYILSALDFALPFSADVRFLLYSAVSLLLQGVLIWQYQGFVLTTYALAYQTLDAPAEII